MASDGRLAFDRTGEWKQMNKQLFERLVESMTEHGEIARGERKPSRQFQFADVGTLRNSQQGRREPTGPVKALPNRKG